jgi:N-acetylglucosamine-6-phosphate deacetylase
VTGSAGRTPSPELVIHGARKLDAEGIVDGFWVAAASGVVVATGTGGGWRSLVGDPGDPGADVADVVDVVDADGDWLTPGFIDLHAHGGGGYSFDDGTEAIQAGLAVHRAHGTTRSVVSLVANPPHVLDASLDAIARLTATEPGVLGAHLEGPFLAPSRKGAHNPLYLGLPTRHLVTELLRASEGRLAQITIAPELPGALEAIETFASAGVVVAVGHTEASYELTREAFDRGATLLTHAFNAMPGLHHRLPGPVAAAIDDERVTLEVIADGVHVHPSLIALLFTAAPGRIALVTDAMAAAGASDGRYRLGTLDVDVRDGVATLADTDTIAGSTLTQDAALRTALAAGVDPVAAVTAVTATPARVLGRTDLGRLREGAPADLVRLTPTFDVVSVHDPSHGAARAPTGRDELTDRQG